MAQGAARPLRQLAQDQGRDLLRCERLIAHRYGLVAAHLALDASHGSVRVEQLLIAGRLAHQQFAGGREADTRGQESLIAGTEDLHLATHEGRDLGVGGTQVNANDAVVFAHGGLSSRFAVSMLFVLRKQALRL